MFDSLFIEWEIKGYNEEYDVIYAEVLLNW
jgi:hypothetical protein